MAIVMGLDQHRAQITAEWIDTDTGEIGRARVSPAHRDDVRKFFKRFAGQPLRAELHYPRSMGEFSAWFATDADCLDYLEWLRWPGALSARSAVGAVGGGDVSRK